jgi:proteasome lid subunit RPN8/RPN11
MRIRQQVIDDVVAHARTEAPNECCGLLAGSIELIDQSIPAHNVKASPTAYLVDPADHFAAIRRLRAEGRAIIGAYHSHPRSEAVPSEADVSEAHYPEFVYLIVSLANPDAPDLRAYEIKDGNFTPIGLVPLP